MENLEFDVKQTNRATELVPDFFLAEIDREFREEYRKMVRNMEMRAGAIQITGPDRECFDPPERVSLKEVNDRLHDEFGIKIFEDGEYVLDQ